MAPDTFVAICCSCSRARRARRCLAALVVGLLVSVTTATPAAAGGVADGVAVGALRYISPVTDGVIIDHFRPPTTPYGSGNRGVDERLVAGSPVMASADGVVLFAGAVAGGLHVTIAHPDGLRTTYSFLAVVLVHPGQRVSQGTLVGLSGVFVHFGVRDPTGAYLDPEALWAGRLGARLVPGPDDGDLLRRNAPTDEARALIAGLAGRGWGSAADHGAARAFAAAGLATGSDLAALGRELSDRRASQRGCSTSDVPVPRRGRRHLAILVGGLGSSGSAAAVDAVDVGALGYAPADVVRFSYRGGRVPDQRGDHGPLGTIAVADYAPADTTGDLPSAAARLRLLIGAVHQRQPGVPIDIIAHSQGGVIARLAIDQIADAVSPDEGSPDEGSPAGVETLVTLGTPNQGAELATAVAGLGARPGAEPLVDLLGETTGLPVGSVAVAQLSETSPVVGAIAGPPPAGVRVVSIGASGDLTVPAVRTPVTGATNVTVHLGGLHAHDQLPAQAAVTREIGLALAGLGPACEPWGQVLDDVLVAHGIARAEASIGLAAAGLVPR